MSTPAPAPAPATPVPAATPTIASDTTATATAVATAPAPRRRQSLDSKDGSAASTPASKREKVPDEWDQLIMIEEQFYARGASDGADVAAKQSFAQGYNMGVTHGRRLGDELGVYSGAVSAWRALAKLYPHKFSSKIAGQENRIRTLLDTLSLQLERFPVGAAQHTSMDTELDSIRAGWKQIVALLIPAPAALIPTPLPAATTTTAAPAAAAATAVPAAAVTGGKSVDPASMRDRLNF